MCYSHLLRLKCRFHVWLAKTEYLDDLYSVLIRQTSEKVVYKSDIDYFSKCFLPSTSGRIISVLPKIFKTFSNREAAVPLGPHAYACKPKTIPWMLKVFFPFCQEHPNCLPKFAICTALSLNLFLSLNNIFQHWNIFHIKRHWRVSFIFNKLWKSLITTFTKLVCTNHCFTRPIINEMMFNKAYHEKKKGTTKSTVGRQFIQFHKDQCYFLWKFCSLLFKISTLDTAIFLR